MDIRINTSNFNNGDLLVFENNQFVKISIKELLHRNGITQRIGKLENVIKEVNDKYQKLSELYNECMNSNERLVKSMMAHNLAILDSNDSENGGN